ncbi:MAG: hypothetical protein N2319_04615 [Candidatus Kapabacteria bacterium]|nr:hypothetical protein [Candidatus Kapabacteria bacterium]
MKKLFILLLCIIALVACTQQQRSKTFGGTSTINLDPGKKLVNITWKEDNLWILTRDAKENEKPEKFEFIENSSLGILEGKIIIIEK